MQSGRRIKLPEVKKYDLLINGQFVETEEKISVYDKFTGEVAAVTSKATKDHVFEAVGVAESTFRRKEISPFQRYEILERSSRILAKRKEEVALALVQEVGKTIKDARGEVDRAVQTLLLSAEEAKRIYGEVLPLSASPGSENRMCYTVRIPIGVIGAITPFNYPLNLAAHKVAPALAAGNTVVLKPASATPLSTFLLAEILTEAGLPPGHLNIITGSGSQVGDWLLEDKRIGKYTFTGSAEVGEYIKAKSGLRRVSLELGNNSPNIVHEDADITQAAQLCALRGFSTAGQACISVQRIYVARQVLTPFLNELKTFTEGLIVGNPYDECTDIGPMISVEEATRVEYWVREAVEQGAKLISGGKREDAIFYPTILTDVKPEMKVVCQEVFGPVVTVIPYDDIDEAIDMANDTEYGLQAGIFTRDLNIAMKATQQLHMGGVIVNDTSTYRADLMPYGGVKNSGIGREGPRYAIEDMTELKVVVYNL